MDFTKLLKHDADEWRQVQPRIYGIVHFVCSKVGAPLTGSDCIEIAEETYILAMQKIETIEPDKFFSWVSGTAFNKASARQRSKLGPRSVDGKADSLDEMLESKGDAAQPRRGATSLTEAEIEERRLLFNELFSLVDPLDREILFDQVVDGLKGREMAEKYGWGEKGEKSASMRCTQALRRVLKVFASDPRAAKLLHELQFELSLQ